MHLATRSAYAVPLDVSYRYNTLGMIPFFEAPLQIVSNNLGMIPPFEVPLQIVSNNI